MTDTAQRDLDLLVEHVKCQTVNPVAKQKAFRSIAAMCASQGTAAKEYLRNTGALHQFSGFLLFGEASDETKASLMFMIAYAIEDNVHSKAELSTPPVFTLLKEILSQSSTPLQTRKAAAFLLFNLIPVNETGQNLIRNSGCLSLMLATFQSHLSPEDSSHLPTDFSLWSLICSIIECSMTNPINTENQDCCAPVLPFALESLQGASDQEVVCLANVVAAITSENARNQARMNQYDGLEAIMHSLFYRSSSHAANSETPVVSRLVYALDSAVFKCERNQEVCNQIGVIPFLLRRLEVPLLDVQECWTIVNALKHVVENSASCQQDLMQHRGVPILMCLQSLHENEQLRLSISSIISCCSEEKPERVPLSGKERTNPNMPFDKRCLIKTDQQLGKNKMDHKWAYCPTLTITDNRNLDHTEPPHVAYNPANSTQRPQSSVLIQHQLQSTFEPINATIQARNKVSSIRDNAFHQNAEEHVYLAEHKQSTELVGAQPGNENDPSIRIHALEKQLIKERKKCQKWKKKADKQRDRKKKRQKTVTSQINHAQLLEASDTEYEQQDEVPEAQSPAKDHELTPTISDMPNTSMIEPLLTSTPKIFKKLLAPPMQKPNSKLKDIANSRANKFEPKKILTPSGCHSEFNLNLKVLAAKQMDSTAYVDSWLEKNRKIDQQEEVDSVNTEKCPGCYANPSKPLNSRNFYITLETHPNTCSEHRDLRNKERNILQSISNQQKLNRRLESIQNDAHSPKTDVYSMSTFSSTSSEKSVSPPSRSQIKKDKATAHSQTSSRRVRVLYTDQEVANIKDGVATIGKYWTQILRTYDFHPSRTAVDLKEKYKRMRKAAEFPSFCSGPRRKRTPFSMVEERRLSRGVRLYGHRWTVILSAFNFNAARTAADLKDKWRLMTKKDV